MKKRVILVPIIAAAFAASGCSAYETYEAENISAVSSLTQTAKTVNTSDMFTENDMKAEYDESKGVKIDLSGDTASCGSDSVSISGSTVTVTDEGTYIILGTLSDGMIIVSAEDTDKIRLVPDGVRISNADSAAIYVSRADKVFVTTAYGSENILSNGGKYSAIDDNNIDAVIFSKDDLNCFMLVKRKFLTAGFVLKLFMKKRPPSLLGRRSYFMQFLSAFKLQRNQKNQTYWRSERTP